MSENEPPANGATSTAERTTILDRLRRAGIGEDRARAWIAEGSVRMAGEPVTDVDAPAPWPTRYTLNSP